uniref:Beta-mannosidase n=1 Tax=Angiostrongylus cantonensis TaxID=6313 RepID=A0A0K0D2I0_ANGCA
LHATGKNEGFTGARSIHSTINGITGDTGDLYIYYGNTSYITFVSPHSLFTGVQPDHEFYLNLHPQVWRIKRHSSVLLWAGNNENEIAIRSHWWKVRNYAENEQVKDYVYLYHGVVKPIVEAADPSRPFLMSSPSNGVRTDEEGGVSSNPGDPSYGDVHFYNEIVDLWRDSSYLTPRCATEFGVQSLPFASTMLSYINASEWFYNSQQLMHRQHHPGGLLTNLLMVFRHFPIPFQCPQSFVHLHQCEYLNSPSFIDRFAYFSQAHQAIVYKVQTEHYRRYRNRLMPSGMGNTMCALYWQLNDVWAAPTWSSIDVNLNWKMVQYEARRFMAPMIVYASGFNDIGISIVNDFPKKITGAKLQIDMLAWTNGFEPVYKENKTVSIDSLSAEEIINFDVFGDVNITAFRRLSRKVYSLTIRATSMSPFTWISVAKPFLGWFSDNGFTMTRSTREIKLHLRESIDLLRHDFSVCNLKNCGLL